ncbi:hypothetical protein [Paenibacillus odorifer]|uniref:Uncharacterized protein n=1 Tax=Paenibacillus odorifer TaxID=189426 RepID=A0A1R0XTA7_9BACL|nr:hypothetical protein [Paenibacillus odorifer]OMD38393.1 hypothetical protein BSK52_19240 [Paenibacillus odorifer]
MKRNIWNCRSGAFARKLFVEKLASKAYAISDFYREKRFKSRNLRITAIGSPKFLVVAVTSSLVEKFEEAAIGSPNIPRSD